MIQWLQLLTKRKQILQCNLLATLWTCRRGSFLQSNQNRLTVPASVRQPKYHSACYNRTLPYGFNQGCSAINELTGLHNPDICLLQESWLTEAKLCKSNKFSDSVSFGCSPMFNCIKPRLHWWSNKLDKNVLHDLITPNHCSEYFTVTKFSIFITDSAGS